MIRLRAEMKLPGRGWLEFKIEPLSDGRNRLIQTAYFAPKGLLGFLYWYSIFFIHKFIFDGMIDQIVKRAEGLADAQSRTYRPTLVVGGLLAALGGVALSLVGWLRRDDT
jgi:hypothetical protein